MVLYSIPKVSDPIEYNLMIANQSFPTCTVIFHPLNKVMNHMMGFINVPNGIFITRLELTVLLPYNSASCYKWIPINIPVITIPDSKVHGANIGPTSVLAAPDGRHVGPMNFCYQGSCFSHRLLMTCRKHIWIFAWYDRMQTAILDPPIVGCQRKYFDCLSKRVGVDAPHYRHTSL